MNYTGNEMRSYRCCFTGHRPEKLGVTEEKIKILLSSAVDDAKEEFLRLLPEWHVGLIYGLQKWYCRKGKDISKYI